VTSLRACVLVAVAVFACGLWLFSEHRSFPFYYHPDEPGKVFQVLHRQRNFHHPMLLLTTAGLARRTFLHGGAEEDPQRVVELARLVMAASCAAAAALLAALATRLHGVGAGVSAGLLLGSNPLLYELAHYVKEDPVLSFGIAACAVAAQHLASRRSTGSLVLLGVAAGIAASAKYVGAALVPAAAGLGAALGDGPARERWRRAGRVAGSALLTFLVVNQRFFRSPSQVAQSLAEELREAFAGEHGMLQRVPHGYHFDVQSDYGGPWLPALATLWLAFALLRPRRIPVAEWLLAGVALTGLAAFSFTPKTSTRYYLPIAVALCFLAAAGAFHGAALVRERWERARIPATLVALALCAGVAWQQWGVTRELRAGFQSDDRAELLEAVGALPPTAIVAQDEAANLPEPERRWQHRGRPPLRQQVLGAKEASELGSLGELRARGVTHLALCRRTYRRYFAPDRIVRDADAVAARRSFYRTALERGRVLREWKPGRVSYLQPGLVLVDISALD
jgi:hypothetical protein